MSKASTTYTVHIPLKVLLFCVRKVRFCGACVWMSEGNFVQLVLGHLFHVGFMG